MSPKTIVALALILGLGACAKSGTAEAAKAGVVAKAITAAPEQSDSILKANGWTAEQYTTLLFEIAKDSARTAAYEKARR